MACLAVVPSRHAGWLSSPSMELGLLSRTPLMVPPGYTKVKCLEHSDAFMFLMWKENNQTNTFSWSKKSIRSTTITYYQGCHPYIRTSAEKYSFISCLPIIEFRCKLMLRHCYQIFSYFCHISMQKYCHPFKC